jgi:Apea-like HEPN
VPPPDQDIAFGKGKLRMYFGWAPKGAGSVESVSFSHWPVFRLDYSEPRAMDELLKDVKRLEDLVTLCSNEATVAVKLTFLRPDIKTRLLSGEDGPDAQKIEYLAPQLLASKLATRRTLHPHQMLLTFAELGGMDAVARWLDFAPRVSRSLDSLMSVKYSPHIYMQNRFLNVAFAAEAFHRDFNGLGETLPMNIFGDLSAKYHQVTPDSCRGWLRQILLHANDTTFRNRLKALVRQADDAIVGLVGDPRSWINAVTKVRNDLTHLDSSHSEFENDDLFYLSESMYSLIRLCMLLEIGAPKRVLRDKALGYRLTWYKERLREAIIRIEAR